MAMQVGETYRCEKCGAEVRVTKPCPCPPEPGMHSFKCCGQETVGNLNLIQQMVGR
jgi:hypothetical protein